MPRRSCSCAARPRPARALRPRAGASPPHRRLSMLSARSRTRDGAWRWSAAATDVRASGLSSGIMSRIVSVWLRAWPIARLLSMQASGASAEDAVDPRRPLVLVASAKGGARVVALNRAAQRAGLAKGELLSNARSKVLDLQTRDADPAADAAALRKLALWCLRYTPIAAPWDE